MRASEISESMTTPYPIRWERQTANYWYGRFDAGDAPYAVAADASSDYEIDVPVWDFSFYANDDYFSGGRVVGTDGRHMRIFATVIAALREFIGTASPACIMIGASKQNSNRFKLYSRMATRFGPELAKLGYTRIDPPAHKFVDLTKTSDAVVFRKV